MSTTGTDNGSTAEESTDPSQERPRGVRRRLVLALVALFTIGSFAMWIYILFIYDPGLLIDELPDKTFPTEAEAICATTLEAVEALPDAQTAADNVERAQVVVVANDYLREMVAELRSIAPTDPPGSAEAVDEWLGDWETHLEDRTEYAERLRSDETARFTESPKAGRQMSRAIDSFAEVNSMVSCSTPGDVG